MSNPGVRLPPAKTAIVACLCLTLAAIGAAAPIWHDEALVLLEFSGFQGWPDHIVSASTLQNELVHSHPAFSEFFANLARLNFDIHPPLYYVLLWSWRHLTGDGLIALRLLSCAAWAGVLITFWRWSNSRFGLALLALSPMGLAFATLARDYALATFWIILTALLLDPERGASKATAVLGGLAAACAVWTHYLALIPVAVIVIARVLHSWKQARGFVVLMVAVAMLAGSPVAYFARSQVRPLTAHPSLGLAGESYSVGRETLRMPVDPFLTGGRLVDLAGSAILLAALVVAVTGFGTRSYKVRVAVLAVVSQALALVLLSLLLKSDVDAGRYLALTLPFAALLIAELPAGPKWPCRLWVGSVMALVIFCAVSEAFHLVRLRDAQKSVLGEPSNRFSELVITNPSSQPGVPAVILHDIPPGADFLALPDHFDPAALDASTAKYGKVFRCGFELHAAPLALFREYSCYQSR